MSRSEIAAMQSYLEMPQYIEFAGATLSFLGNILLFYLIYFHSRKEYGDYKILMLNLAGLYIVYSLIEMIVFPSYFLYEYNYLLFTTNFTEYQEISQYLIVTFCAMFACIQMILAFQFLYRYHSVTIDTTYRDRLFKGPRHLIWMTATLIFFCNWFLAAYHIFGPSNQYPTQLEEQVKFQFGRSLEEMSYTLVNYAREEPDGTTIINYKNITVILYLMGCASIPILSSLVFGVKTWSKMRISLFNKSGRMLIQEKQLFKVLVIQFTVPLVCNTVPMLVLFICPAFRFSTEPYTNYICMPIPFYPVLDSIATIYIIRDYSRALMKCSGISKFFNPSSFGTGLSSLTGPGVNSVHAVQLRQF